MILIENGPLSEEMVVRINAETIEEIMLLLILEMTLYALSGHLIPK